MADGTTSKPLESEVRRIYGLVDAMEFDAFDGEMMTDDVQIVNEITRRWVRGLDNVENQEQDVSEAVSDLHSVPTDIHETIWGDTGVVTMVLEQSYSIKGETYSMVAPTTWVFRHVAGAWKVALVHTMPLPAANDG